MRIICRFPLNAPLFNPQSLSRTLAARRDYITSELATVCCQTPQPRILCVGGGLLREAEPVLPFLYETGGEFVSLDRKEDADADGFVETVAGDPFSVNQSEMGSFHFIYALNLISELSDQAASRAIARLASMLEPGGRMVVTNFSPALADSAPGMPALQRTVFRSEEEVARLTDGVPDKDIVGQVVWRDESDALVYLEVQK